MTGILVLGVCISINNKKNLIKALTGFLQLPTPTLQMTYSEHYYGKPSKPEQPTCTVKHC